MDRFSTEHKDHFVTLNGEIRNVAYGWFRNEDGVDVSYQGNFSIGEILAPLLLHGFSSIFSVVYRHSLNLGQPESEIYCPTRIGDVVLRNFELTSPTTSADNYYQWDETFFLPSHMPTIRYSRFIRLAQLPFKKFMRRRRTLWITDHISQKIAALDQDGLVLFGKSLTRGVTTQRKARYVNKFQSVFPAEIEKDWVEDQFNSFLERENVFWSEKLRASCLDYLVAVYEDIRPLLVEAASIWEELLDVYRPEKCCLPSDSHPLWLTLIMSCRSRGVKTVSYLDGYPVVPWLPIAHDRSGTEWLLDEVVAYDDLHKSGIIGLGFPEQKILDSKLFPFTHNLRPQQKTFDFLIVSYWANPYSCTSDYSSPPRSLRTVLNALSNLNPERVGVKIRHEPERAYVEELAQQFDFEIEVLIGSFRDFVGRAHCVIGGFSTALTETRANGIKYVVFEPFDNGYTDDSIAKSFVVQSEEVARDGEQLLALL
jgi:hypothetical protein